MRDDRKAWCGCDSFGSRARRLVDAYDIFGFPLVVAAAVLALTIVGAPANAQSVTLYAQTGCGNGDAQPDQAFEAMSYAHYDSEAADDFIIVGSPWSIDTLKTEGIQDPGPGLIFYVKTAFYADNSGLPGSPVCDYPATATFLHTAGDLLINLVPNCILPAGHYWVSQQVRQDFIPSGSHRWEKCDTLANNPAAWRNPGDGYGSGCFNWAAMTSCPLLYMPTAGAGPGAAPDLMFELDGSLQDAVPVVGPLGILMMVLALSGGTAYVLSRRRRA